MMGQVLANGPGETGNTSLCSLAKKRKMHEVFGTVKVILKLQCC